MKSIKPGRVPSGMSFISCVFMVIFGIFWTILAFTTTANVPGMIGIIFPLFGVIFVIMGIIQAIYHFKNATSHQRFSMYDITDENEENEPLALLGEQQFCSHCGEKVLSSYSFCPKCGEKLK